MSERMPVVNYLSLDEEGTLTAVECTSCGSRFLDRERPACGSCGSQAFRSIELARTGSVRTFTIVHRGAPGVPVPFISIVVDLDEGGPAVRANLLQVPAMPESVPRDLRVELQLTEVATDSLGNVAVGFGFVPIELDTSVRIPA
jgi:uncharacterized OB-fold protein